MGDASNYFTVLMNCSRSFRGCPAQFLLILAWLSILGEWVSTSFFTGPPSNRRARAELRKRLLRLFQQIAIVGDLDFLAH